MKSPIQPRAASRLAPIGSVLVLALGQAAPARAQDVPFETLAHDLLRRAGQDGANPDTCAVHDFLIANYVRARLGLFEGSLSRTSPS